MDRRCKWCGKYMGQTGVGGALLRAGTGFGEYCGAACKEAAEASDADKRAERAAAAAEEAADNARKNEGMAAINAITLDGDASVVVKGLTDLWTIIQAGKTSLTNRDTVDKQIKAAAIGKYEVGLNMLRSKGDTVNLAFFEQKLADMKKKAKIKLAVLIGAAVLGLLISFIIASAEL